MTSETVSSTTSKPCTAADEPQQHRPLTRLASGVRQQLNDLFAIIRRDLFQSSCRQQPPTSSPADEGDISRLLRPPVSPPSHDQNPSGSLSLDDLFFSSGPQLEQKLFPGSTAIGHPEEADSTTADSQTMVADNTAACFMQDDAMVMKTETVSPEPFATAYSPDTTTSTSGIFVGGPSQQPSSSNAALELDSASLQIYRDLILRHLVQDISATCMQLSISSGLSLENTYRYSISCGLMLEPLYSK